MFNALYLLGNINAIYNFIFDLCAIFLIVVNDFVLIQYSNFTVINLLFFDKTKLSKYSTEFLIFKTDLNSTDTYQ